MSVISLTQSNKTGPAEYIQSYFLKKLILKKLSLFLKHNTWKYIEAERNRALKQSYKSDLFMSTYLLHSQLTSILY